MSGGVLDEAHWPREYPDCGGKRQSPIDLQREKVWYNPSLRALNLSGYEVQHGAFLMINNGHTGKGGRQAPVPARASGGGRQARLPGAVCSEIQSVAWGLQASDSGQTGVEPWYFVPGWAASVYRLGSPLAPSSCTGLSLSSL